MIEPASCHQYKATDVLAFRPLKWDETIDGDDDYENRTNPGEPICWSSRPSNRNDSDISEGEEYTLSGENGIRQGNGTQNGKGNRTAIEDREGTEMGTGNGKGYSKGKVIIKQTPGEIICLMLLLCSFGMQCMRQTQTLRAN
jgi:hypothetical protein